MEVDGIEAFPLWAMEIIETPKSFHDQMEAERQQNPGASSAIDAMESLHLHKLYHELTDAFAAYIDADASCDSSTSLDKDYQTAEMSDTPMESLSPQRRLEFLWGAIVPLRLSIDPIRFLKIVQCVLADIPPRGALLFLEKLESEEKMDEDRVKESGGNTAKPSGLRLLGSSATESHSDLIQVAFLRSQKAFHRVLAGDLKEAEEIVDWVDATLSQAAGVDPVIRAAYHKAAAELAKARSKLTEFYKHSIIFLAYTSAGSLNEKDRIQLAEDISIVALICPEIYNFGELLQQAVVLSALRDNPERKWIFDLLEAFNCGSMDAFEKIMRLNEDKIMNSKLANHLDELHIKASTAALLRLAFTSSAAGAVLQNDNEGLLLRKNNINGLGIVKRPPMGMDASHTLTFSAISSACRVPLEQVERLVVGAMAQRIIKGKINQLSQELHVNWVRPVLLIDEHSLRVFHDRLCRWAAAANDLHKTLQAQTAELLGS